MPQTATATGTQTITRPASQRPFRCPPGARCSGRFTNDEQVRVLVEDFFEDAADDDAEAVCGALTPDGRARAGPAAFRRRSAAAPRQPGAVQRRGALPGALASTGSSVAMDHGHRVRVPLVRIQGAAAVATVRFTGFQRTGRFRRGHDGWKIDDFSLPVRE